MRFNCQNCGAKYQIADEKVAGKTVRMKCRKCAELIQVKAEQTPAGVRPSYAPVGAPRSRGNSYAGPLPSLAPNSTARPQDSLRPRAAPPRPFGPGAGSGPASRPGGGLPPRPSAPGAPRPLGGGLPPRPSAPGAPRPGSRPSGPGVGPRPAAPPPSSRPGGPSFPKSSSAFEDDESTVIMQRPIQAELEALQAKAAPAPKPAAPAPKPAAPAPKPAAPAPKPAPPKAATEPGPAEWYVGIDGEPVGPIDKGYLEEQIAEGKVTGSSLVWREELTDWRPLNSFAELRSLLTTRAPAPISSAATSAPVALTRAKEVPPKPASAEPPESRKPAPSAPDSAQPVPDSRASGDLSESSVPSAAEEVPPSTGMPVGLAGLAPPPSAKPSSTVAETPEAKDAGAVGLGAAGTGAAGTGAADEPAPKEAQPAAPPVVEPSEPTKAAEPDEDDLALAGIPADRRRQGRGLTPMAYAFIAMATAFGAVSAWFLFGQREGSQPVAQAPSGTALTGESDLGGPPPSGAETSEPTAKVDATASAEPDDDGEATTSGVGARVGTSASATSTSETTEPEDDGGSSDEPPPCSPDDPFCGTGPSGPSAAPDDDGGSGSGAGLSPSQAQSVVSRYKGSLMRRCRSMVTKGSAKVGATIVVGASGAVKSVAVSGGGDYPGLAGCVRSRIKNWSFPSSGGSTTINVSFNFL